MTFSIPHLLSDVTADECSIGLDMPGGGYDRLFSFLKRLGILPQGKFGRNALIFVALVATRIAQQLLGPLGPVTNFFLEVGSDAVREQGKRLRESAPIVVRSTPRREPLARRIDNITHKIAPWMGRE